MKQVRTQKLADNNSSQPMRSHRFFHTRSKNTTITTSVTDVSRNVISSFVRMFEKLILRLEKKVDCAKNVSVVIETHRKNVVVEFYIFKNTDLFMKLFATPKNSMCTLSGRTMEPPLPIFRLIYTCTNLSSKSEIFFAVDLNSRTLFIQNYEAQLVGVHKVNYREDFWSGLQFGWLSDNASDVKSSRISFSPRML